MITSVSAALTQYATACEGAGWQASIAAAQQALEAIRYLLANRAREMGDQGSTINFDSLESEKKAIEQFLGGTSPRAFGRTRRVRAAFQSVEGIQ